MGFWRVKTDLLYIRFKIRRPQSELFYWKRICLFRSCKNVVLLTRTWWLKNCQITLTTRYFFTDDDNINIFLNFSDYSIKKWKNTKPFLKESIKIIEKLKSLINKLYFQIYTAFGAFTIFFSVYYIWKPTALTRLERNIYIYIKKKMGVRFAKC